MTTRKIGYYRVCLTMNQLTEKAKKKEENYTKVGNDYFCKTCGSQIHAIEVIFPIWDSGFSMAGSGKTTRQYFPYCPKCETEPQIKGIPIKV